jgi:hypothetical protein
LSHWYTRCSSELFKELNIYPEVLQ